MILNLSNCSKSLIVFVIGAVGLASCHSEKIIVKTYIDDGEMPLSIRKVEKSEISFQLYREGASGATGGKSSGGCGCN